jgi:ADP-ribose pyrophosphatase YjhB (NUDIX family)
MKFCTECSGLLERRVPPGDNRARQVCAVCGTVHYENPKIVAGCIPEWEGRILLCRRAIEPRYGLWTLPAGFMENDETTLQAAERETLEEAKARVDIAGLYALFNLPHLNQVYVMFRGRLVQPEFGPGEESLEVALFEESAIPWNELAFPVVRETLRLFFHDRSCGQFGSHLGDIIPIAGQQGTFQALFKKSG